MNTISKISQLLRSDRYRAAPVETRVQHLRHLGYEVERVRHIGSHVGSIYRLKSGEYRIAVDSPRGLYRTAWAIIVRPFGIPRYYS